MTLGWQALFKAPGAFEQIARLRLTLVHSPRTLVIHCPMKTVQEPYGYIDFARIKKDCILR